MIISQGKLGYSLRWLLDEYFFFWKKNGFVLLYIYIPSFFWREEKRERITRLSYICRRKIIHRLLVNICFKKSLNLFQVLAVSQSTLSLKFMIRPSNLEGNKSSKDFKPFYSINIYFVDSDLVWRMQLMIIKG